METMFFHQQEVGHHAVFAYIIGDIDSGEAAVVDPADDGDDLIALARENHLEIKSIINTHGHVDHVMGNAAMQEKTGAKIIIHEAEADYLEKIGTFWLQMFNARKSPAADETVRDGDILTIGRHEWNVLHTPGHTPGSICLKSNGLLFTGDILFYNGIGRSDFPHGSESDLHQSLKDKVLTNNDDVLVYPGHGPSTTIGREKKVNTFL